MALVLQTFPKMTGQAERDFLKKENLSTLEHQSNKKIPLREGFTIEEKKELQFAVSVEEYIRKKGIEI